MHGALVDATTGYIAAAYNSGDDVHPSDAGHFVIADAFSDVIKREVTPQPWPVASVDASNLATNPLFPDLTGWTDGGGTGTATPTSHTDTTGHLPYGKWMKYVISAAGGYRARTTVLSSSLYTVGETLLICAYMDATITDSAGYVQLNLNDGSTIKTIVRHIDDDAAPYQVTAPVMRKVVVPSLSGSLQIRLLASGVDTIGYLGAVGVFNLSRMGIA